MCSNLHADHVVHSSTQYIREEKRKKDMSQLCSQVNDGLASTSSSVTQPPLTRACAALLVAMKAVGRLDHQRWVRQVAVGTTKGNTTRGTTEGSTQQAGEGRKEEGLQKAIDTYALLVCDIEHSNGENDRWLMSGA